MVASVQETKQNIAVRSPEGTVQVCHQCMEPTKVAKYFTAFKGEIHKLEQNDLAYCVWNMDEAGFQLEHKPR